MMPRVIKYLLYIALLPIYCISFVIPRNRNIWVFGCWSGQKFADNSKYLFLYVKERHPEIRAIWLTHNTKVVNDLREGGYEAYKIISMKSFFYSIRASCAVISNCLSDINGFVIGKAKIVQLWHGTPLKKINYDSELESLSRQRMNKLRRIIVNLMDRVSPFSIFRHNMLIAASEETKQKLRSAFMESKNQLYVMGYPRTDALFDTDWLLCNQCDYLDNIKRRVSFKYIITYLPTHRQLGKKRIDLFTEYGFEINAAQRTLEKLNAIFLIKAHYFDEKLNLPVNEEIAQRIYNPSDDELPDIYPLLKETDILITDYSSVYLDYLLLNRPIIFTPFDIEEYIKEEGLYYDYDEATPGPKAKDWPDVFKLIPEIIGNDRWKQEREAVCNRFNKFKDNHSSERVFKAIQELLA